MTCLRLVAVVAVLAVAGVGAEWDVYPGAGTPIQDAIDGAGEGDTIYVHAGTYDENVDVDKRVTLIGEGADVVTVRAADASDDVFYVTADWVNISGFAVTGATGFWDAGIYLDRVNYCNIYDNNASNNDGGISMGYSNNNTLTNNTANSNDLCGIRLYPSSNNNTLMNNNASSNNWYGIYMGDSSNNTLVSNTANSNDLSGIILTGSSNNAFTNNILVNDGFFIRDSYRNTVKNNTVNGKPLAYLEGISNFTIQSAGQVILVNCTNVTVENLDLSNASIGVELLETNECKIANNIVSNNRYGIYMGDSSNNTLVSNTASNNLLYGIYIEDSSNNTLVGNTVNSNDMSGIFLAASSNNVFTNNILVNGGFFIRDPCRNTVKNNTVNGKPLAYLEDISNLTIQNAGQVILVNCTNVTVENLNLSNASIGVELLETNECKIANNIVSNNWYGIYMVESSNNTLQSNIANSNTQYGIYLWHSSNNKLLNNNASSNNEVGIRLRCSSNNTLQSNTANSNDWYGIRIYSSNNNTLTGNTATSNTQYGIYLWHSSNNTLYHNDLINNIILNACDNSGTNQWDSGSVGNYYSDYTGTDTNRDGIGDTPHDIPGGESVDRYPLTGIRWLPPEITRSRLGINTHWNHWAEDLFTYKEKTKNFGVVRDQSWWAGLETTDLTGSEWDHANWDYSYSTKTLCGKEVTYQSGLDNLVKLYQDEDSPELLLLLNLKNDNISSFETITADQYYDYVYHVVERYDRDGVSDMPGLIRPVRYFEVGNEVDYIRTNDSRHGYLSPEDYVEKRLIPAYNAAKAANKDAIVMGSGLGMESDLTGGKTGEFNTAYLEAMYDNITASGGSRDNNFYMDKIAIHYYSQNEHPEYFDENIKEVEDVIMNKEGREKPIWITEFAPASPPSLYARLLTLMFANRIEMPMIYNLKDDSEESFGLYNVTCVGDEETITPRESIQVIDTVLSTLHGTTPSEAENEDISTEAGKTIYQRVFSNSEKKVTVLWYIDDADSGAVTNCMIFPELPQTFTVDVLGTANFSTDSSPINLKIGSEPTYVVETDPPIDVDLYFNKTTTAGVSTERATSFAVGDTLYGKIKTATIVDHTVKTYITMTMPDGTCQYAHYDKPDFDPGSDKLLFSDTKIQLYDGVWSATTNDWLWNIYEFTGGDSGIYRWNCWYEDAETGEILGGDSAEYTFSETPSGTPVGSATYEGKVYLDSSAGAIENIAAIPPDAMPEVPESLNPVYGFFSFEITGISSGESVNIPLAFPENVPAGTEYWKHGPTPDDTTPHWYQIPVSDDDGDRIIVITLTDGGIGDDDLAVNGVIVDDGGPSLPKKGDLNRDGNITTADAAIALQLAVIGGQDPIADVSGDNRVTSLDALMILQAAAGNIEL